MRFILILDRHANAIEALLTQHSVTDVEVVRVGRSERRAPDELLVRLRVADDLGVCEIDRSYRKSLNEFQFGFFSKSFRVGDVQLLEWLVPPPPVGPLALSSPRVSFEQAAARQPRLVLADTALERADALAPHRWPFAAKAAEVLANYAAGEPLGPMRDWNAKHGVAFAPNGKVIHGYQSLGKKGQTKTEWHLKDGDRTSAEAAARVYFDTCEVNGITHTIVLYVGPHPPDGTYTVGLSKVKWVKEKDA